MRHITMVRPVETDGPSNDDRSGHAPSTAVVVPMWQPARYGEEQRPNLIALLLSVTIVGALLAALVTMNFGNLHVERPSLVVLNVLAPDEPPAPPPPPKLQPVPLEDLQAPSLIIAPEPMVRVPAPPAQIVTTSKIPPPEVAIPGPSTPSPKPSAAPAIESVGDLSSKMIAATPPRYPHESRRRREEGAVLLLVLLDTDGSVADISISRSSGYERLDQAALRAVRRWRWSPTLRGGTPVMVRGLVEIPFVLQNK